MADKVYQVYSIKCTTTGKYFVGVTASKNMNLLKFINQKFRQNGTYKLLGESIITNSYSNHIVTKNKKIYTDKLEADMDCYKIVKNLIEKDLSLNDSLIDPTPIECADCGSKIKTSFLEVHKEKYCKSKIADELYDNFLF